MKISLAIPHASWVPARVESMARLRSALGYCVPDGPAPDGWEGPIGQSVVYREFTDREPNIVWAVKLWSWLAETDADWCLQLQDDVLVAPCFWPALRAALSALPPEAEVIGLATVHPMAVGIARRGLRWFRTPGNLVGWSYALRRTALVQFLADRAMLGATFQAQNEDEQIGIWAARTKRTVWHPVPAITDHDVSIGSTYANESHTLQRPQVTWRTFAEVEMVDPKWWSPTGTPELLGYAAQRACWWCLERPVKFTSAASGAGICGVCIHTCIAAALGLGSAPVTQVGTNERVGA